MVFILDSRLECNAGNGYTTMQPAGPKSDQCISHVYGYIKPFLTSNGTLRLSGKRCQDEFSVEKYPYWTTHARIDLGYNLLNALTALLSLLQERTYVHKHA
jgi:hypothetical protein